MIRDNNLWNELNEIKRHVNIQYMFISNNLFLKKGQCSVSFSDKFPNLGFSKNVLSSTKNIGKFRPALHQDYYIKMHVS